MWYNGKTFAVRHASFLNNNGVLYIVQKKRVFTWRDEIYGRKDLAFYPEKSSVTCDTIHPWCVLSRVFRALTHGKEYSHAYYRRYHLYF